MNTTKQTQDSVIDSSLNRQRAALAALGLIPKRSARKVSTFGVHTVWTYKGYTITSIKKPGWNSGTTWTARKENEDGFQDHTKKKLMQTIDRHMTGQS